MSDIKVKGLSFEYSDREKAIVSIMRINAAETKREIRIKKHIGRLEIEFHWRSAKNLWGRFGGGWNWKLGIDIGSTTIIIALFIFTLRFSWKASA